MHTFSVSSVKGVLTYPSEDEEMSQQHYELVLLDFESAMFYDTNISLVQRYFAKDLNVLANIAKNYQSYAPSTASDAVLGGKQCMPADEACSVIYCALQAIFPDVKAIRAHTDIMRQRRYFWTEYDDLVTGKEVLRALDELRDLRVGGDADAITEALTRGLDAAYSKLEDI